MKISEKTPLILLTCLIIIASFVGGILGNWLFMYALDTYYYGAPVNGSLNSDLVIRSSKKSVIEEDVQVGQAIISAETALSGIFSAPATDEIYLPERAVGQGLIITGDGWLATDLSIPVNFSSYRVATSDKTVYEIDKVVADAISGLTFLKLKEARNMPVRDFVSSRDLIPGQTVIALRWHGEAEVARLSRALSFVRSSDSPERPLLINGLTLTDAFIFDSQGRVMGLLKDGKSLAIDSVRLAADQLIIEGEINRVFLGFNYLEPGLATISGAPTGILLTANTANDLPAVLPNSPAAKAGLRAGDVITVFDGVNLTPFVNFSSLIQEYFPGDKVNVSFKRGESNLTTEIVLEKLPVAADL